MNETLTGMLCGLAGAALGVIFFGGLWWTVRQGVASGHPALWFLGSGLLRTILVLAGFYFVGGGQWPRLVSALVGFIVARFVVLGLTRPARENKNKPSLIPVGQCADFALSRRSFTTKMDSSTDESFKDRLRLFVSAMGIRGPAHRRLVIPVCDQQTPKTIPETISRRGEAEFRPLAKPISGSQKLQGNGLDGRLPKAARNRPKSCTEEARHAP